MLIVHLFLHCYVLYISGGVMALFCLRLSSFVFRFVSSLLSCFLLLSRHFHFLPKFVFPYYTVLKTEVYCLLFMKWIYFNAIYYSLISEVALNDCEIQKHFSKFTSYLWEVKNWTNDLSLFLCFVFYYLIVNLTPQNIPFFALYALIVERKLLNTNLSMLYIFKHIGCFIFCQNILCVKVMGWKGFDPLRCNLVLKINLKWFELYKYNPFFSPCLC